MNRKQRRTTTKTGGVVDAAITGLYDEAMRFFQAGAFDLAADKFRKAISRNPAIPQLHNNLGSALKEQGLWAEAIASYRAALQLDPSSLSALNNLASCLFITEQFAESEIVARKALALQPGNIPALVSLGIAQQEMGRDEDAIATCRKGLARDPSVIPFYIYLSQALTSAKRPDEALDVCLQGLKRAPSEILLLHNLGQIYHALNRLEDAVQALGQAVSLHPQSALSHSLYGLALVELGHWAEAIAAGRRAVDLAPHIPHILCNMGNIFNDCNELEQARFYWEKALELKPDQPTLRNNLALLALKLGDFTTGWRDYEWRWAARGIIPMVSDRPEWQGEDLAGRTIMLYGEQGHGDMIQFLRYVPLLARRGARVLVAVHSGLLRLAAAMPDVAEALALDAPFPPFDLHLPLMSVPRILGTTLETIPAEIPYLQPDPVDVDRFAQKLASCSGLKVGLVWAGNNRPGEGTVSLHRNLPVEALKPLLTVPGISLVNLQMGDTGTLAALLPERPPLDLMDEIRDFADTAALIQGLDLVLTVDTAVAHLAGALGKPVWMFQRLNSDWRWLTNRNDSPWYPTMRIYQQTTLGDWATVIAAMTADLEALVKNQQGTAVPSSPSPTDEAQADSVRAARIAIQAAAARSERIAEYLEAPIEGVPDVLGKLEAFCRDRQSLTDYRFAPAWHEDLGALLTRNDPPALIRLFDFPEPMAVLPVLDTHCPNLYRSFLVGGVLLLLRKDVLFDFCTAIFLETGAPTIFRSFIKEILGDWTVG